MTLDETNDLLREVADTLVLMHEQSQRLEELIVVGVGFGLIWFGYMCYRVMVGQTVRIDRG